jgi:O-antigen ligase
MSSCSSGILSEDAARARFRPGRPMMQTRRVRSGPRAGQGTAALIVSFGVCAILLGLTGAWAGWMGQVFVLSVLIPVALVGLDYRHGILLALVLMPYMNSPLVPQLGALSAGNVLMLSVTLVFLLRLMISRIKGSGLRVPLDRALIWLYLVPITLAAVHGSLQLGEIPQHFLARNHLSDYGLKTYWISLYLKQILLVLLAIAAGAAVMEYGTGRRFVIVMVISAVIFVGAIIATIIATGVSLERAMSTRGLLSLIGRQNNEAGVLLLGAFGPCLFMREMSRNRLLRMGLLLSVLILAVGILLTGSRGAFLGMTVMTTWYLLHFRRARTAVAVVAVAAVGALLLPDQVADRLMTGLDSSNRAAARGYLSGDDELTAGRLWIYEQMLPDVMTSPIIGHGLASTQWSTPVKKGIYFANHPHNLYIEVLLDLGLIGAGLMAAFFWFVWCRFKRLGGDERLGPELRGFFLGGAAGLLGMLTYGLSNGHYYPSIEQWYFWVTFGLAAGFARRLGYAPTAGPTESALARQKAQTGSRPL